MPNIPGISTILKKKPTAEEESKMNEHEKRAMVLDQYKIAMKEHDRAVLALCSNMKACMKSLDAVAESLEKLSKYTPQPNVVSGAATLHSGVKEVNSGQELDDLLEELEFSGKERYVKISKERKETLESCKRRDKALDTYDGLRNQCVKLEKKKDNTAKDLENFNAQCIARDAQAVEYCRYETEFKECYEEFLSHMGVVVLEDSRELTTAFHTFYSSLSYQFRKFEELLAQSPPPQSEGLSMSVCSTS